MSKNCGECAFFMGCERYEGKTRDSEAAETCRAYLTIDREADKISLKKTAQLMAEMFSAKPCQLANVHKGIARRLPLRCSWTPDMCDHRTVAECWERLLGYPTMADKMKEE